jgi:hypothetical protein
MGDVIEGRFRVVGETQKPPREPIIASWWGIVRLALFIALNCALGACLRFAYGWGMAHNHLQLSELFGAHR